MSLTYHEVGFKMILIEQHINIVTAPLMGAPYIQKLFFWPSKYHMKNQLKLSFSMISKGAATFREQPLMAILFSKT